MNNFSRSIDTDMAIGSILSNFDSAWIIHTVQDSLNMRFRPFADPMPNFVDITNRQFDNILLASPDYSETINSTKEETFREIINTICNYYNLSIDIDSVSSMELYGVAHMLYDIFISRFTDYMVSFYIRYVMGNIDSIYSYLSNDESIKKPREKDMQAKSYIDPKFQLIHANLNKVILNMVSYDISLEILLSYFVDPNTAQRLGMLLNDKGDIYKNYYASYLLNDTYMAELLTCIKLELQKYTQIAYNINKV